MRIKIPAWGFALAIALLVGGYFFIRTLFAPEAEADPGPNSPSQIAKMQTQQQAILAVRVLPSKGTAQAGRLRLRGVTEPNRKIVLKTQTSGRIERLYKREGERVRTGDLICQLFDEGRSARLAEAVALEKSRKLELEAMRRLAEKNFRSQRDVAAAEAAYKSAQAARELANNENKRRNIRAPFPGHIESIPVEEGALIGVGHACAEIVELDPILLVAQASVNEAKLIETGMAALLEGVNNARLEGKIQFVGQNADASTRSFRVEAVFENNNNRLPAGASADLLIHTKNEILHSVPASALLLSDTGEIGVKILTQISAQTAQAYSGDHKSIEGSGFVEFRPVEIMDQRNGQTLLSGLPEEAHIVILGQEYVQTGQQVVFAKSAAGATSR